MLVCPHACPGGTGSTISLICLRRFRPQQLLHCSPCRLLTGGQQLCILPFCGRPSCTTLGMLTQASQHFQLALELARSLLCQPPCSRLPGRLLLANQQRLSDDSLGDPNVDQINVGIQGFQALNVRQQSRRLPSARKLRRCH